MPINTYILFYLSCTGNYMLLQSSDMDLNIKQNNSPELEFCIITILMAIQNNYFLLSRPYKLYF